MNKVALGVCHAAIAVAATSAFAQQQPVPPVGPDWSKIEIKTTDLGRGTYMLEGAGGNITVALGKDGIIMVDGQFAPLHDKIKAAIEGLSKQPVKFLINTHYHGDHTGGNEAFAKDGVTVVAHPNVRARLAAGVTNGLTGAVTPGRPPEALPKLTYIDATLVKVKGRRALLKHPPNAHTDGDTFVFFKDANVLATGDTVTIGRYPNIDFANGGSINGMIAASDAYLMLSNNKTKIVPGHGALTNKAGLAEYRAMLATARDRMAKLIAENKSEAEVVAAKPFADLDKLQAVNERAAVNFIRVVYNSLKPK